MATSEYRDELIATAKAMCSAGKGLLAADESTGTIGKRFAPINVENNEDNRRAYRGLLVGCSAELSKYVSGVIMDDAGVLFTETLKKNGIVTGIKLDLGVKPLAGTDGETATQGLDNLDVRCKKYYEAGARFSKWRNVLKIDSKTGCPSELAIQNCAETLARYASISQAHGIVPIVEPETLLDGPHSIEECALATERALVALVSALHRHKVLMEACVLKPNMVTSGKASGKKDTPGEVGMFTVRTLSRGWPAASPGVFFLSGGQSEEEATVNLCAVNKQAGARTWHLSFSYGRALQASCLKAWQGKKENVEAAQKALLERAKANSEAQLGKYEGGAASGAASESLYVADYKY